MPRARCAKSAAVSEDKDGETAEENDGAGDGVGVTFQERGVEHLESSHGEEDGQH